MRRFTTLIASFALLLGFNLVTQAGGNDADAIIDKAIKAHLGDGKDSFKKGYRGKNKGTLYIAGMELEFTQDVAVQQPTKFKEVMELSVMGMKIEVVTVFNGKEGWIKSAGKDVKVENDILEEFKDVGALMSISHGVFVKDKTLKLSVIGEAMVNGKPCMGVKISREGKKPIDMYFDKETGLTAKVERMKRDLMNGNGNEVTEERIVLEYQKVGGRAHPKKVVVNVDGKKLLEAEVIESQFVDKIDDAEFNRPQ
jgi:hypothetical protein